MKEIRPGKYLIGRRYRQKCIATLEALGETEVRRQLLEGRLACSEEIAKEWLQYKTDGREISSKSSSDTGWRATVKSVLSIASVFVGVLFKSCSN